MAHVNKKRKRWFVGLFGFVIFGGGARTRCPRELNVMQASNDSIEQDTESTNTNEDTTK
jgi:hypothetical protein